MASTQATQDTSRKRSLILAGGGVKVAFQAGVLQVWLDEAGVVFDHADGASGGCFNLAMYVQGQSGREIADNWRSLDPLSGLRLNLSQYDRLFFASSIFTYDAYRTKVFPRWGLDWTKIRASQRKATFNYYNFSRFKLEVAEPSVMTEDKLVACVSLPMWFAPVVIDGDSCIDAVYDTDANLEEAIRRGADELWVIWTVSEKGVWSDGFVNNYFQIIEIAANSRFRDALARIDTNNKAITEGRHGEFGRHIEVKILRAEVDLNYLVNVDADRIVEAVNRGVEVARDWCRQNGIAFTPLPPAASTRPESEPVALSFSEKMKGFASLGQTEYDAGFRQGRADGKPLTVQLLIETKDVTRFVTDPQHEATVTGMVCADMFGGDRPVQQGAFNLLVDTQDPVRKAMYYRLFFTDARGQPRTLIGFKDVRSDDGSDAWTDTTTLYTRILEGYVNHETERTVRILAAGIIRIHMLDFLEELTTFRVEGPNGAARLDALTRFGILFLGKLWDVYAHRILPSTPF
jgi:predicted patatin/cPLA2 family phospholipase